MKFPLHYPTRHPPTFALRASAGKASSMNHLAHCLLSFGDDDLLIGNFMGDFVKGSAWKAYPVGVQQGILLHRTIDAFSDAHPLVLQSVARLRPWGGRYTAPVVDVLYDYLLAQYWPRYSGESLENFNRGVYARLEGRAAELPPLLRQRLPFMLAAHFLDEYGSRPGLRRALARFSGRIPLERQGGLLADAFFQEEDRYGAEFNEFFPALTEKARTAAFPPGG
jgi:acyl carrier protein phosphodiesterase